MEEYYSGFLSYIETNIQCIKADDINVISHLHAQYSRAADFVSHKSKIESTSSNGDTLTFQVSPSLRGIQNDRSNCWANAILQAICATPIVVILEEGLTEQSTSADNLIKTLVAFFHEMSSTTNAETSFQSTVIYSITCYIVNRVDYACYDFYFVFITLIFLIWSKRLNNYFN